MNHESDFSGLRCLNKEHTTSLRAQKRGSKWTGKGAAKPSLFVLTLELHFIASFQGEYLFVV
jgi:hypothetical protein